MTRPRFYRDPVHGQIRYNGSVHESLESYNGNPDKRLGWVMQKLIDCKEFQRLRHIRQNGPANLVFHGAEHSRFSHSMGVAYLAREMFNKIIINTDSDPDPERELATCVAALLHDIGHGPFSHTMEEILKDAEIEFDHEKMTQRIIEEPDSEINAILRQVDEKFPEQVVAFIDKKKQKNKHWCYKIISSQLDADRLDYLLRDSFFSGIRGHGFDILRLLDMLQHCEGTRIAVDKRAIEAVEAYLVTLDQMYRAVYFHHSIRAASTLLSSTLRRALDVYKLGDNSILPNQNPLTGLLTQGESISLDLYSRIGEYHIWALVENWQTNSDKILSDLSTRLINRKLFKTIDIDVSKQKESTKIREKAEELSIQKLQSLGLDNKTVKYYVSPDEPSRISYKLYNWIDETEEGKAGSDESIWIKDKNKFTPIENYQYSQIVDALKKTKYFHRLMFPVEIKDELYQFKYKLK